jgi:hypothetical protein
MGVDTHVARGLASTPAFARLSPAVSATQPTETTASAASALSRVPSDEAAVPAFSWSAKPHRTDTLWVR